MKHAHILRFSSTEQGTSGTFVCNTFICASLELPWNNNQPNVSCIPSGSYIVKIRKSKKYGIVFHITDVKGRTYILIHSGNVAGDMFKGYKTHSKGCILFGAYRGRLYKQKAVLCSKPTIRRFMNYMGRDDFKLTIHQPIGG